MQAAFQRAFVALASDARMRARFAADPTELLRRFELDDRAARALRGIDPAALARYATSLLARRWRGLRDTAPLTARIYVGLGGTYRAWAERNPDPGETNLLLSPGAAEGLRALPALRAAIAADDLAPTYTPDLLTFEIYQAASRRDGAVRELCARFALHEIVADLQRDLLPTDPAPTPTRFRFEAHRTRWKAAS